MTRGSSAGCRGSCGRRGSRSSPPTELAAALKDELQRRVAAGEFYGFIAYGLVLARKPA